MDSQLQSIRHDAPGRRHPFSSCLASLALPLLLILLALVPRILPPDTFVTVDEAYHWFDRTGQFLDALQDGDYAATNLVGHPGVTTMWLGALGALATDTLTTMGMAAPDDAPLQRMLLRLPIAIAASCTIALAYPLLRRLLGRQVALLAVLLWAGEPFLVAHSQLLHVDALLASLMTLSLLAAMAAVTGNHDQQPSSTRQPVRLLLFTASAIAGGLAFLTKSPSVVLVPMIGLVLVISSYGVLSGVSTLPERRSVLGCILRVVRLTLLWGAIATLVWIALWPAAWVDLRGAADRVIMQVRYEGGEPHAWGNFFLGRTVDDPGPLFYPVAVALRLTPWTMLGLLAAGVLWLRPALRRRSLSQQPYLVIATLMMFVVIFAAVLTIAPKKFDRYMLPVFPALDIIAAWGLWHGWLALRGGPATADQERQAWSQHTWVIGPVGVVVAINLAWYHPYEIAYYNPLLGGGPVAARTIPVGWGEGFDLAGHYISEQFNGCDYPVASWFERVLGPFTCTPVVPLAWAREPGRVAYVVLYIDQIQRRNRPEVIDMLLEQVPPVHTVRIHGIEYAYIYQLPPVTVHPMEADFGSVIRLHGYDVGTGALRSSGVVTLTTHWQARAPIEHEYALFIHLLNGAGEAVAQVDVPPGGPRAPTTIWQPHQYVTWFHPVPVPADLPAGSYWFSLGLYDPVDFSRLPLQANTPPAAAPDDGDHALLLGPVQIP